MRGSKWRIYSKHPFTLQFLWLGVAFSPFSVQLPTRYLLNRACLSKEYWKGYYYLGGMPESPELNAAVMAVVDCDDSFKAKIQYLARDEQHRLVKPYYLHFNYESDIPPTNTSPDDRFVRIRNARNLQIPSKEMFLQKGFTQLHLDCSLTPEEYYDDKKVEEFLYPKYRSAARHLFPNAARIEVLEHAVSRRPDRLKNKHFGTLTCGNQVRKRHPLWLSESLERHELNTNQPSDYVHIDMTASSAAKCSIKHFNISPKSCSRFVVVNLWKPIRGPVYDFPLTVCDRSTVDYESQATAMDIVTSNYLNENTRIYFDDSHKWYYWHGLQADEVIAFVQADSQEEDRAGVPHTAFYDARNTNEAQLRESIEARVFVYFD